MTISIATASVGLALILVAGVIRSITFDVTSFNPATLTNAFFTIGYLVATVSGVILAGCAISNVVKGGDSKKLMMTSIIIAVVGITLVLISAALGTVPAGTWGTGTGSFNPGNANALNAALSTVGYLAATLAGVILVTVAVTSVTKEHSK